MKMTVCSLLVLMTAFTAFGQLFEPVQWDISIEEVANNEYVISFSAQIEDGWQVFSTNSYEKGPIPAAIYFNRQEGFATSGQLKEEGELIGPIYSALFEENLSYFENKVTFFQKIVIENKSVVVAGYLEFMTCDDDECLPPTEVPFQFTL